MLACRYANCAAFKYDVSWNPDSDSITVGERRVALHARACLALEHYMILRPILRGDYLFVGSGSGWSMKTGCIYAVIRRLARMLERISGFRICGGLVMPARFMDSNQSESLPLLPPKTPGSMLSKVKTKRPGASSELLLIAGIHPRLRDTL